MHGWILYAIAALAFALAFVRRWIDFINAVIWCSFFGIAGVRQMEAMQTRATGRTAISRRRARRSQFRILRQVAVEPPVKIPPVVRD